MKRVTKFITIPISLFDVREISILAKWVLISIDSVYDGNPRGVNIGVQAIASMTNMTAKAVKDALNELYEHGALEVAISDGIRYIKPLMYKSEYKKTSETVSVGDSPKDAVEAIDYEYIREQWNQICLTCPKIERMTPQRKLKTRTMLKKTDATVQDLIKVFKLITSSSFLRGDKSDWVATYDWLIKSADNFTKVFEGNYHAKDYHEQQDYSAIMQGRDITASANDTDDFYR